MASPVFMTDLLRGLVAQAEEPRAVPAGAGDGEGDLRQAPIGLAVPGKAIGQHGDPLHMAVPFAGQHGAGPYTRDLRLGLDHGRLPAASGDPPVIEQPTAFAVQVAKAIGLQPIGQHAKQQMPGQVRGRLLAGTRSAIGPEDHRRRDRAGARSRPRASSGPALPDQS